MKQTTSKRLHLLRACIVLILLTVTSIFAISSEVATNLESGRAHTTDNKVLVPFIKELISTHFSVCTLISIQDGIVAGKSKNADLSPSVLSGGDGYPAKYIVQFGRDNFPNNGNGQAWSYQKLSSVPRHRMNCVLTLIWITSASVDFIKRAGSLVAPAFLPFSRNDRDHYIFIAKAKIHEGLLKMKEVHNKFKYKIALGVSSDRQKVEVTTVDIFGCPLRVPKMVSLSPNNILIKSDIFPDFLKNLRGNTLQISIPFGIASVEAHLGGATVINNGKRGRFTYLFNEFLMVKFNFTYRMFVSAGGTGRLSKNGSWSGAVGDLYYDRADIALVVAKTDSRLLSIGFTDTYFYPVFLTFVTGPATEVYSMMALLWPFHLYVWAGILGSAFISLGVLSLIIKYVILLQLETSEISLGRRVVVLFAPLVEQDIFIEPRSTPLRCFVLLWLFFTLIMTTLYRSQLVTLLAFPTLTQHPRTFGELAFSDFEVGFMKAGDAAYNAFAKSRDPVYSTLLKRMEVFKGANLNCLQKVVNNDRYSCIAYDFDVEHLQQSNFSNMESRKLQYSGDSTYNIYLGLALQPNSIFKESFSSALGQTLAFHLVEVWNRMDAYENLRKPKLKWWAETNQTAAKLSDADVTDENNLTLSKIRSIFYVLYFCLSVSALAFLHEYFARIKIAQLIPFERFPEVLICHKV